MSTRMRGQGLVEFALIAPILLVMVFGLVMVFQFLLANHAVAQAVRAGAHQAAIYGGDTERAIDTANVVLDSSIGTVSDRATVQASCASTPCRRYDPVTVQVTYQGAYWTPVVPGMTTFTIQAEAVRASERDEQ